MDDVGSFHRFARHYDAAMPDADAEPLERGLSRAEREIRRVVDLAGGTGRGLRAIEGRHRNATAFETGIVVDAARGMCQRAQEHGHRVIRADAGEIPFADGTVDAVVVIDAFHHLPAQERAITEAARILAPGGVLVVQEFDPTTLRGRALAGIEHLLGFESSFHGPAVLAQHMRRAGLDPVVVDRGFSYVIAGSRRAHRPSHDENGTHKSPAR